MLRKSLLTTAAVVALGSVLGGSAFAADLPSRSAPPVYMPPPPPIFTWSGVYLGGQIGYRFGTSSSNLFPTGTGPGFGVGLGNYSPGGVVGGAHVGYNYQIGMIVAGLEGDIEGSSYNGSQGIPGAALKTTSNFDSSIRGRLGFAFDRALIYSTGGVAFAQFRNQFFAGGLADDQTTWRAGWTLGAGLEYAITNNWSVRAEYRYTDYGRYTDLLGVTTAGASSIRKHDTDNSIRAGFSYKFDMFAPPAPILAKY